MQESCGFTPIIAFTMIIRWMTLASYIYMLKAYLTAQVLNRGTKTFFSFFFKKKTVVYKIRIICLKVQLFHFCFNHDNRDIAIVS